MVRLRDTSPAARRLQIEALRGMAPSDRLAAACELSDELWAVTLGGIHQRHPAITNEQAYELLLKVFLGVELAERVRLHRDMRR